VSREPGRKHALNSYTVKDRRPKRTCENMRHRCSGKLVTATVQQGLKLTKGKRIATGCTGAPGANAPSRKEISALPLTQVPSGKISSGGQFGSEETIRRQNNSFLRVPMALLRMLSAVALRESADALSTKTSCSATDSQRPSKKKKIHTFADRPNNRVLHDVRLGDEAWKRPPAKIESFNECDVIGHNQAGLRR
jgi:hypothetical protein